jgi:hypothetical protein
MSKADICRRPHAFRDSPQIGLAVHIGAQLPLLVQGLHYDQWRPASRIWLPAGSVRRVSYRERLSEQTFYTWRKRYGWLSGRTGEGRGADVTRRQVNAPLRKLVEPYLAIEFVKKVTIKKIAVWATQIAKLVPPQTRRSSPCRLLGCTAISARSRRAASRGEGEPIRSSYPARSARPSAINHATRFSDLMRLRSYMV